MKKHTKKELKEMVNEFYGPSHYGEKIIDIYSFSTGVVDKEIVKVMFLSPVTHTVYKETYAYYSKTDILLFEHVDGIL